MAWQSERDGQQIYDNWFASTASQQSKHADVVQYLDYLENLLGKVHAPENQQVPENETCKAGQVGYNFKWYLGGD